MKTELLAYSTVKGLLHEQKGIVNQDSYIAKKYKFGTVLVVSDGMGSHKHSEIGSKAVCKAVCIAIQQWQQYKDKDIRLVIPLIHSLWNMEIYPYPKGECGATCLFSYISNDDKLYIGQLGDGSLYVSIDDEIEILHTKDDEFSNFTSGLSSISSLDEWSIKEYDIKEKDLKLIMMTDGVSETLIEETKKDFVCLVWDKVKGLDNAPARNNFIYQLLKKWNKTNAGDDRTIVCYEKI